MIFARAKIDISMFEVATATPIAVVIAALMYAMANTIRVKHQEICYWFEPKNAAMRVQNPLTKFDFIKQKYSRNIQNYFENIQLQMPFSTLEMVFFFHCFFEAATVSNASDS